MVAGKEESDLSGNGFCCGHYSFLGSAHCNSITNLYYDNFHIYKYASFHI